MSEQPLICLAHKVPLPCRECGGPLFAPPTEPTEAERLRAVLIEVHDAFVKWDILPADLCRALRKKLRAAVVVNT